MLFENLQRERKTSNKAGSEEMSLLLVRPFDIMYKGDRYPVLLVRVDSAGNRHFAVPNAEEEARQSNEAFKWIAERWIDLVIPADG